MAAEQGAWDGARWSVILVASFLVHLATNLANDLFDHLSGVDREETLGGSRALQQGKIKISCFGHCLMVNN